MDDERTVESDAWVVISNLRDQHPRLPDDCPTDDIVAALAADGLLAAPETGDPGARLNALFPPNPSSEAFRTRLEDEDAEAKFDERLSDVQAEYLKREQSWDRTRDRLTRQRAELLWLHAEAVWLREREQCKGPSPAVDRQTLIGALRCDTKTLVVHHGKRSADDPSPYDDLADALLARYDIRERGETA